MATQNRGPVGTLSITRSSKPLAGFLAAFAITAASCLAGCVDLTEPWKGRVVPAGTGGVDGGLSGVGGDGMDGSVPTGGSLGAGAGTGVDATSLGGAGGSNIGALDVGPGGTSLGGASGNGGAPGIDMPIAGTGGNPVDIDGGLDVPMTGTGGVTDGGGPMVTGGAPGVGGVTGKGGVSGSGGTMHLGGTIGTGGKPVTGGTTATGGATPAGGATGTGGTPVTGGATGTGGTATPDAAPDAPADLPSAPPDTSTLGTGLVVYYTCESASGATLPDKSGNGNDGTLSGAYAFSAGKVGNALTLTSSGSGYVSMPAGVLTALSSAAAMTVSTWVNLASNTQWQRIFDIGSSTNLRTNPMGDTTNHYMNLVPADGFNNMAFSITASGIDHQSSVGGTGPFPSNTWTHVAVVIGGGTGTLYINGAVAAGSIGTNTISLKPSDLAPLGYAYIGSSWFTGDPFLSGQIDDFRIYSRALSAAEVTALYQFTGP